MINFLRNLFGSDSSNENDAVVGGAESVFNAIQENILGDKQYIAELGEPQLVDRGGQFSTDYMVLIPTFTESGDPNPPDLEYDLPDGEMGETANGLFDLLSYYGIDEISDLGKLRGESVAAEFEDGTLSLRFDELQGGEQ